MMAQIGKRFSVPVKGVVHGFQKDGESRAQAEAAAVLEVEMRANELGHIRTHLEIAKADAMLAERAKGEQT